MLDKVDPNIILDVVEDLPSSDTDVGYLVESRADSARRILNQIILREENDGVVAKQMLGTIKEQGARSVGKDAVWKIIKARSEQINQGGK